MVQVLTTKEYKAIKKPVKRRFYETKYWNNANTLITETVNYDSYNNAYFNLLNYKVLSVKFVGWL